MLPRESSISAVEVVASQTDYVDRIKNGDPDIVLVRTVPPECVSTVRSNAGASSCAKIVALEVPDSYDEIIDLAEAGVAGCCATDLRKI